MVAIKLPPPPKKPVPKLNTEAYLNVIRAADVRGVKDINGAGGKPGADGKATLEELTQYKSKLNQQVALVGFMEKLFGTALGGSLKPLSDNLKQQQSALDVMVDNFVNFSGLPDNQTRLEEASITFSEVTQVAQKDGNGSDITQTDVDKSAPSPGTLFPMDGGGNPIQNIILQLIQTILGGK